MVVRLGNHGRSLRFSPSGQVKHMHKNIRRTTIVAAAFGPIAALSVMGSAMGSAQPPDCVNGQFWDPISNTCKTPRPADDCAPGQYWNALSQVCRPLGQL